ncbi:DNA/RNA non-specific endonuclease [Candidatus Sumerlaeota bacterium]|nr:DNA/RNA non-specific endonuclease [Candidatus Sumerlaeota bacterium]
MKNIKGINCKELPPLRAYLRNGMILFAILLGSIAPAADYKPIILDPSYDHDRFNTQPKDIVRQFEAYTVSFDGPDDDDGDGKEDRWGIPQWVAYEIKKFPGKMGAGPPRPSEWITDKNLFKAGIAPSDKTYAFSAAFRKAHPDLVYDRGHLCMKQIAFRLGANADWNTHTVLNACPQRPLLNEGIWLDLEQKTEHWADEFGAVWVVCGPIVKNRKPAKWLGEANEMKIAIPDAFFKIIIKEAGQPGRFDVLAFIYPQDDPDYTKHGPFDHKRYLKSVDEIEKETGLNFLSDLPAKIQNELESSPAADLWN